VSEEMILAEQSVNLGLTVHLDCTAEDFTGNEIQQPSPMQPSIEELSSSESVPVSSSVCPANLALAAVETSLSSSTLQKCNQCFENKIEILHDRLYSTWKFYKYLVSREQRQDFITLQ